MDKIQHKLLSSAHVANFRRPQIPQADLLQLYGVFQYITDEVNRVSIQKLFLDVYDLYHGLFLETMKLGDPSALYELYVLLKPMEFDYLLRFALPDLVCEAEETVEILKGITSDMMFKIYYIVLMKRLFLRLEIAEQPATEDEIYACYLRVEPSASRKRKLGLERDQLLKLFKAVNYYSLDFDRYKMKKEARTAIRILEELRESQENQLKHAVEIYRSRKPNLDAMIEMNQAVRARYPETQILEHKDLKTAFYKVISDIKKATPLEFLTALLTDRNANDIALENGFLYRKFTQGINAKGLNKRVLLVNPPPMFLMKWLEDQAFVNLDCTVLCMDVLEYGIVCAHLADSEHSHVEAAFFGDWCKDSSRLHQS